jgi:5'(3')-deoxyribonucleotidase
MNRKEKEKWIKEDIIRVKKIKSIIKKEDGLFADTLREDTILNGLQFSLAMNRIMITLEKLNENNEN